jgi:hypothetical protein
MKKYKDTIVKEMSGTKGQLESLHTNIGQSMEKINARERFLNNQLEPQLAEYRKLQVSLCGKKYIASNNLLISLK